MNMAVVPSYIPSFQLSTVGHWLFPVAESITWNSLYSGVHLYNHPSLHRSFFSINLSRCIIIVPFFPTFIHFCGLWNCNKYYKPRNRFWLTFTDISYININFYSTGGMYKRSYFTSCFTSSIFSMCLASICLRTNSGPLNFLPLNGHNHLSFANSCVLAVINFSTSVDHS